MRLSRLLILVLPFIWHPSQSAEVPRRPPASAFGCSGCHGSSGEGYGSIPRIRGKSEAEFFRKMQEFRADKREATVMNRIARGFDEAELALLAKYFSHN